MESKGQMAIFYEGCRIIKLNEQICFGTAAFFHERDSVTENRHDKRKNCNYVAGGLDKGKETYFRRFHGLFPV